MKLDPRHLEVLAAIVDRGGLTEGADDLGKSQPSLSRTVALLEDRIGAALFVKGRRPLQPTELGSALAAMGRSVRAASDAAAALVDEFRHGRTGRVRLGGTPIFMDGVVAAMIAAFHEHCPDVRIDQSYAYAPELIRALRAGEIDIAVCPLAAGATPDGFAFQPLLPGMNVVACRPGHPLAGKAMVTAADIARYGWIAPPPESPLYADLRRAVASIGAADFRVGVSGGTLASVMSVLAGSDALTVLPDSVVFAMRGQNRLAALPVRIDHPDRQLGLLARLDAPPSPAIARFRAFLLREFEALSRRVVATRQESLWRGARNAPP